MTTNYGNFFCLSAYILPREDSFSDYSFLDLICYSTLNARGGHRNELTC